MHGRILLIVAATGCAPDTVVMGGTLRNVLTGDPIEGGEVCVTSPADVGCGTTDFTGHVALDVPANLDVLDVRVEAADYFPTQTYAFTTDEDNDDVVLQILPTAGGALLELATGVDRDPSKGLISFWAKHVEGGGAEGISVSLSPDSGDLYYLTSDSQVDPDATATLDSGSAGFMNVDPGFATLSAPAQCTSLFTYANFAGTQEIEVEANTITFVSVLCEDM